MQHYGRIMDHAHGQTC